VGEGAVLVVLLLHREHCPRVIHQFVGMVVGVLLGGRSVFFAEGDISAS
jgi:hypothetical protein